MLLDNLICAAAGGALAAGITWLVCARRRREPPRPAPHPHVQELQDELRHIRGDLSDAHHVITRQTIMAQRMALVAHATSNAVIVTDRSGQIEWVNDGFTRITGFKPEEVLGRKPGTLLQGAGTDQATVSVMRRAVADGTGFRVQVLNYTRLKKPYWIDVESMPVRDEDGVVTSFVGIQTDITQMKEAQAELARSAGLLRETQAAAHIGGWEFDVRGGRTFWTEETYRIHGLDPATHRHTQEGDLAFFLPGSRELVRTAVDAGMRNGTSWNLELQMTTADRRAVWVRSIGHVRRDEQGTVTHLFGSFQDITQERTVRDQMAQAAAQAQAADRAKSSFLAMMSHEIRTPMNGVIGMAELLGMTKLDEDQRQCLSTIVTSGELLLAIIDDILDFSKIEAGKLSIATAPTDLHALVVNVIRLLQPTANDKRLDLAAAIDPMVPLWVEIDGGRVRQILINLIGNALKFTREGSVRIAVGAGPVGADGRVPLTLAVTDTGIGIPLEVQQQLFQPFVQAEGAVTTRTFGGTGLGLAICKRLAELMGGSITLHSRPDHGSTFTVHLAVAICHSDESRARMAVKVGAQAVPRPTGRLALVVEDNPVNQMVEVMLLKSMGFHQVATADDGRQALALAQASRFDVILMDSQMPLMDGYAATRAIRQRPGPNRATRIIALTANVLPEDEAACLAAGMDAFVTKPINAEKLRIALTCPSQADPLPADDPPAGAAAAAAPAAPAAGDIDEQVLADLGGQLGPEGAAVVAELIGEFMAHAAQQVDALEEAVARGQAAQVKAIAHRLRGQGLSLGLTALVAVCMDLERAGADADGTLVPRLRRAWDGARAWLEARA